MKEINWFQSFLINSADAFIEYSPERKYLSINPAAAKWMGLETTAVAGKTAAELLELAPKNPGLAYLLSQLEPCWQQVLQTGEKRTAIHEVMAGEGLLKIYETIYTPVAGFDGTPARIFAVGRDITPHYRWQQHTAAQLRRDRHLLWLNTANSPLATIGWDENFHIIHWSKRAEELFGWPAPAVIGKSPADFPFVYETDSHIVNDIITQLLAGNSNTCVNRNYTQTGQLIWCRWFNSIIRNDGSFTILSLVEDITEHKRLEAVEAEATRLTALAADVGIALTRHPDDILRPCCQAAIQHLEVLTTGIWTLNAPENCLDLQGWAGLSLLDPFNSINFDFTNSPVQNRGQLLLQQLAYTQQPFCNYELSGFDLGLEQENVPPFSPSFFFTGYPLIVEERLVGIIALLHPYPFSSTCLETLASVADVIALGIERKRTEAELKSARTFLNSVIENLPVGVFAKDAESLRFVLWNRAGEAIAGYTHQEIVGKSDYDVFPKEQADAITAQDREVLASCIGEQSICPIQDIPEEPIQTRHRGLRILHTRKIPILNAAGVPQYLLGITEDITERKQVDESVRLYGQIVENMQIGLYVYHLEDLNDDRTLRAIASNPAATLFTGVEMADVLGMTIDEIFPQQRARGIPQAFATVIREQQAIELEDIDRDETGTVLRAFSVKAFPLPNSCVGVAFENITERKRLEFELHQALQRSEHSERLLRTVIDATPDWIFAKDRNFRYILANQSFAEALGKSAEELLGFDDVELGFPAELIFGCPERNIRGFRLDDQAVFAGQRINNPYDPATVANGDLHVFDTQKIPLRDPEGNVFAVLAFSHDITERYQAQIVQTRLISSLQASEERFRSLVANIPGIVYRCSCGETWEITFMSETVYSLTGYRADDFVKGDVFNFKRLIYPEDLPKVEQIISMAVTKQQGYALEYRLQDATQTLRWVWEQGCVISGEDGKICYLDGVIFEITSRKESEAELTQKNQQLEQALQQLKKAQAQLIQAEKMLSLGQLVAGIAHEINNPINFIYANLLPAQDYAINLLKLCNLYHHHYPEPPSEIMRYQEEIDVEFLVSDFPQLLFSMKTGADRIRSIVLSLRNFSRIEEADLKTVDIHEGIDSTLLILQHRFKESSNFPGIKVYKEYQQLPLVECYPGLLNQVMMNILCNAIDALSELRVDQNPEKQFNKQEVQNVCDWTCQLYPSISIQTRLVNHHSIKITIADNGPGMSEQVKNRIFDPFFTTKSVGKGTGLGLSISYQIIVEKHHGSLRCISAPGAGAEFIIEIPLKQNQEPLTNLNLE